MDELFGVSMSAIMAVLLAVVLAAMAVVGFMAWRNPIMVKLGLRNIPRRRAQTVLIVVGIMLSTVIISAAFGTGDTISFSIRNEAVKLLGTIDEIIVSARATSEDSFAASPYFPYDRFQTIARELDGFEQIDGLSPEIGETVPAVNLATGLSEGRMRVAGISAQPQHLAGFDPFVLESGGEVGLSDLAEGEAYINDKAAEELDAAAGDRVDLFVDGEAVSFTVAGVVERGGLAGARSTVVMPLERAQALFGREGEINFVVVSNLGDKFQGREASEDVTRRLRVLFADHAVAASLADLLAGEAVLGALEDKRKSVGGTLGADLASLGSLLRQGDVSDSLVSLLADERVSSQVLWALERDDLQEVEREAATLFRELGEFRVADVKRISLDAADEVGSEVTSFFIIMGLFSIMVGVLLIFLIFVMLTAARRSEMGMARAVGAKRHHLVQMFLFEGTAYAAVSAAVGVVLGLAAAALIVAIANRIFAGAGGPDNEDFRMSLHFEARSIIAAYCLGMAITFATIAVSAYRVSRLNIVAAVRGLPAPPQASQTSWRQIVRTPGRAFIRPFRMAGRSADALVTLHPLSFLGYLLQVVWSTLSFPSAVLGSLFQLLWVPFKQGWLAFLMGVAITWAGISSEQAAPFRLGSTLMIIGLGLTLRFLLLRTALRADLRDRIAYTFIGVVMLVFWVLPFELIRKVAGDLSADIEMFFIAGIAMVAAAVWTVMYNSDLILKGLTCLTGGIGKLRPVLVTAVAYPMSAKFRTGLTLAMFALVIFTLIVMSILTETFSTAVADVDGATGRWDIQGTLNFNTPISDIREAIDEEPGLDNGLFSNIGGYTTIPIEARQVGAKDQRWRRYAVRATDDPFLEATDYRLKLIANGYGNTSREVWEAMSKDSSLAVVESFVVPTRSGFREEFTSFQLEGFHYEDDRMPAVDIEVREPRTGEVVQLKVIGVMNQVSDAFGGIGFGMFASKSRLDEASPYVVPITTYRFRLADGADEKQVARDLESSFRENGMETEVLAQEVRDQAAANRAFNYLFTGFMGLGLLVGVAALGVISLRAVVERRQQIGVLRAIGYRRNMVQLSFLLESSFVVLLGTAIGVVLGSVISYNIVEDIRSNEGIENLRFSVPWIQIVAIVAVAYLFSLATTLLPARQASRIYPAEALRYE